MKKIVALYLCICFLILTLSGCQKEYTQSSTADAYYFTFEDAIDHATDIVRAKCITVSDEYDHLLYEFEVLERYLGEDGINTIHVIIHKNRLVVVGNETGNLSFYEQDISYEPNEEYFLVLERQVDALDPVDVYLQSGNSYLPCANLSASTMYGQPILNHSQITSLKSNEDVANYIIHYLETHPIENRPLFNGTKAIDSDDMETIIKQSEFVLKVKIDKRPYRPAKNRETVDCTVITVLKGDIEADTPIEIIFPIDSVREGKTYIVALTYLGSSSFILSSKDSLFKASKEKKIMKYID